METDPAPFLGVLFHAIGGLAAASFYVPYKQVRRWPWENAWLLGGFFSWIVAPSLAALLLAPATWSVIAGAPPKALFWTYAFGFLWGIGGLTYGLTMRYLGIALGNAVALGMCAFFGTLVPPVFSGEITDVVSTGSGRIVLAGVFVCLLGIAMSGRAGLGKEREMDEASKKATIAEFNFLKGMLVAVFAGAMSACMAFGFAAGKPIGALATESGIAPLWQNLPVLVVVLAGGFTLNFLWCAGLILRRGNARVYLGKPARDNPTTGPESEPVGPGRLGTNYLWCILAGFTWYLQFFFYGMGTTKMGRFEFSSWTLHMASIIIFGTIWGLLFLEWKGVGRSTRRWLAAGLATLILSTIVIGWGNALAGGGTGH